MLDMQTRMCVNEELTVELKDTCPYVLAEML